MKNIIKKLEKAVEESKATLQKVKPKKKHMRTFDKSNGTKIIIHFNFYRGLLDWIHISFRWEGKYQFSVNFAKGFNGEWYQRVEFGNDFYNLDEEEQLKRAKYFLIEYSEIISYFTNQEHIGEVKI